MAAVCGAAQPGLSPFPADRALDLLDLDRPGLASVREVSGDRALAMARLLEYYRTRNSVRYESEPAPANAAMIGSARATLHHVLDVGLGYPPQRYGADINWMADPVRDIEWVAGVQRFYWQTPLARAWTATHDPVYVRGWMDLTSDWIGKHPINPEHFAWLDIQVGIRAAQLAGGFDLFRSSGTVDTRFLETLLASVYDHGLKMSRYPRTTPHNKTVIEAVGLLRLAVMFPEFKDSNRWAARAWEVLSNTLPQQVTPEGVQREWTPAYHQLVASLMLSALRLADDNHLPAPRPLRELTAKMFDFWFAMIAPERRTPMFGDARRAPGEEPDQASLRLAAKLFNRPEYGALSKDDEPHVPGPLSRAFPESGMYFFRSGWGRNATYLALHSSPPALSGHDQPDNGTFELHAGRRWLIEDSGSFAYPNTPFANERDWFQRTAAHATLTLNGANSRNAHRHLLWKTAGNGDVLVFENRSYPGLTHRRTVFFGDRRWFLFVDEALGDAPGTLELRFPYTPGAIQVNRQEKWARTDFAEGTNLLICAPEQSPVSLEIEPGKISYTLNHKQARQVAVYRHLHAAPAVFVTLLLPYGGSGAVPHPTIRIKSEFQPGQPRLEAEVATGEARWLLGRDLSDSSAWITRQR